VARAAAGWWEAGIGEPRERTPEQDELDWLKRRVGQLERALGRKTYELEVAGELSRGWE
jgi:transposase